MAEVFNKERLRILRLSLGPDSLSALCLLLESGLLVGGARITLADLDAAVFTDTGSEMPHSYEFLPILRKFTTRAKVPFFALMKPPRHLWQPHLKELQAARKAAKAEGRRFRGIEPPWRISLAGGSLEQKAAGGYYHARAPLLADVASKGVLLGYRDRSCADNHKMIPLRALINDLSKIKFGLSNTQWGIRVGKAQARPHIIMDGATPEDTPTNRKHPAYEYPAHPLREMGITAEQRAEILKRWGFGFVRSSRCFLCRKHSIDHFDQLASESPNLYRLVRAYEGRAKGNLFKGGPINDHLRRRRKKG